MSGDNLGHKASVGFVWVTVENISVSSISFIIGIIMARLLTPEDFGLVAVLSIFILLAQTVSDAGCSMSLIQNANRTEEDFSTAFFCNVIIGILCYVAIYVSAPVIAGFYCRPQLVEIVRTLGIVVPINALGLSPLAKFDTRLDFRLPVKISVVALLLSGATGIWCAYSGYGVWALVAQQVLYAVLRSLLLLAVSRPSAMFSIKSARHLFRSGIPLLGSRFINIFCEKIYPALLGKVYNSMQLGYYTKALSFSRLPAESFMGILQRVSLPSLSSLQNDDVRFSHAYGKMIRVAAFCFFPIMTLAGAVSGPLVEIVLTDKWSGMVPLFRILVLSFMLWPVHSLNLNALIARGRNTSFLKVEIIKMVLRLGMLGITIFFGIRMVCWGQVVVSYMSLLVNIYCVRQVIGMGVGRQLLVLLPSFVCSLIAGLLALEIQCVVDSRILQLIVGLIVGVVAYWIMSRIFNRRALSDFIETVSVMYRKYITGR